MEIKTTEKIVYEKNKKYVRIHTNDLQKEYDNFVDKIWVAGDDLIKMLDVASHFKYASSAFSYIKEELNSLSNENKKED